RTASRSWWSRTSASATEVCQPWVREKRSIASARYSSRRSTARESMLVPRAIAHRGTPTRRRASGSDGAGGVAPPALSRSSQATCVPSPHVAANDAGRGSGTRRRARRRRDRRRSGGRCPPTSTSTRPGADEAPFGSVPSVLSPANAPHHPVHPSQCPGGTVNRRILLSLLSILALVGVASCSSGDGDAASAGDGRPDETPVETRAEAGEDRAGDDADNPVVFGYEVDGPAGTTAVVVSTLVAQGQDRKSTRLN